MTGDFYLLINYSIYRTYTGKCVGVILVTFLLSSSPHLTLPRTYTAYLGPIRFTLGNMDFTLDNTDIHAANWPEAQSTLSRGIVLRGILIGDVRILS